MKLPAFALIFAAILAAPWVTPEASAQSLPGTTDHYFTTSDNVRLHYDEAGPKSAPTIILVPGWTIPAWIFAPQIRAFSAHYHVIAFDPRAQGASQIAPGGYNQDRRGQDIGDLITHLGSPKVTIIGWSLGVLDTLAYIHNSGDSHIAALVLVDNSVGENPPPAPMGQHHHYPTEHSAFMRAFIPGMFRTPQSPAYLNRLINACLRVPADDARLLLAYPVPRTYWREALFSTSIPVLYIVRPHLAGQAQNLTLDRPNSQTALFPKAGHALFVDEPAKFNTLVINFIKTKVQSR
ncbi:MAG: alpha/beta hydrolase [Acidocella sp.]|nr:alpha/beta hydrolase [Acidocella sp.]